MNRREALSSVALLLGGTIIGSSAFLSGCKANPDAAAGVLSAADMSLLNDIAEIIIPTTNTPGAKAAKVGEFMGVIVTDCYDAKDQKVFKDGLAAFASKFSAANAEAQQKMMALQQQIVSKYHREASIAFRQQRIEEAIKKWDIVLHVDPSNTDVSAYRSQAVELQQRLKALNP
mgnify:CR=1 FL=1